MADRELSEGSIRYRYKDLDPLDAATDNKAYARYHSPAHLTPLGYRQLALGGVAVALPNIPTHAQTAHIRCTKGWRWRDDGTNPTPTLGMYVLADEPVIYDGDLAAMRVIASGVDGELNVSYYV